MRGVAPRVEHVVRAEAGEGEHEHGGPGADGDLGAVRAGAEPFDDARATLPQNHEEHDRDDDAEDRAPDLNPLRKIEEEANDGSDGIREGGFDDDRIESRSGRMRTGRGGRVGRHRIDPLKHSLEQRCG